jgi:hypothetical protein
LLGETRCGEEVSPLRFPSVEMTGEDGLPGGERVLGDKRSLDPARDDGGLGCGEAGGFGGDAVELGVGVVAAEGGQGGAAALDAGFDQRDGRADGELAIAG